jgi:hypothetical protein
MAAASVSELRKGAAAAAPDQQAEMQQLFQHRSHFELFIEKLGPLIEQAKEDPSLKETLGGLRGCALNCIISDQTKKAFFQCAIAHAELVVNIMRPNPRSALRKQMLDLPLCLKAPLHPILPNRLYLGDYKGSAAALLNQHKIGFIVAVVKTEHLPELPVGVERMEISIEDSGEEWEKLLGAFPEAFKRIDQAMREGKRVFIHCSAGVSRSSTLVIAYLMHKLGVTRDQAFAYVYERRPFIRPIPVFMAGLKAFEKTVDLKLDPPEPFAALKKQIQECKLHKAYEPGTILQSEAGGKLLLGRFKDYPALVQAHPQPEKTLHIISFQYPGDAKPPLPSDDLIVDGVMWGDLLKAISLEDTDGKYPRAAFEEIFVKMDQWLQEGKTLFIQCSPRLDESSHSSSLVIAYLMDRYQLSFEKALAWVKAKYPLANPNHTFRDGLLAYEESLITAKTVPELLLIDQISNLIQTFDNEKFQENFEQFAREHESATAKIYAQLIRLRRENKGNLPNPLPKEFASLSFQNKNLDKEYQPTRQEKLCALVWTSGEILLERLKHAQDEKDEYRERIYYAFLNKRLPQIVAMIDQRMKRESQGFRQVCAKLYNCARGTSGQQQAARQ